MHLPLFATMVGCALAGTTLFAADAGPSSKRLLVYIGTYTGPQSKGIYVVDLDLSSGQLGTPRLAAESASPSFLAIHPNRRLLYAVNELGDFQGTKGGAVSAFSIDGQTGLLQLLNQQPSGGASPCHVNVDRSGKNVLIANYGGGSCAVLPLDANGHLQPASAFVQHTGSSANPSRQEAPHAHGIYLDAANHFAFVPDLGLDKILIYRFKAMPGTLEANDPPFATVAPGSGPRHLAFHPNGRYAYVINEMACTITAFTYDPARGALNSFQTISTLPAGQEVLPAYSTAEIEVHPSGKFLYGSNRGHDTIAAFQIDPATGKLSLLQHASTQGKTPRGFGIEPGGRFLVAGNQDTGNLVTFHVDAKTGRLSPAGESVQAGIPVCIKFLPR